MPANPFLINLGLFILYGLEIYSFLVVIRIIVSWISPNPYSPVMMFLTKVTDPVLNLARRIFPFTFGGIDFSPILAIFGLHLLGTITGNLLIQMAYGRPPTVILPIIALQLIGFLDSIAWLLIILMGARFVVALVQASPYNILVRIIYGVTEPLLAPLRRFFPPYGTGGIDFRPLVFMLIVILLQRVVLYSLAGVLVGLTGAISGAA